MTDEQRQKKDELNAEYTKLCMQLGDLTIRQDQHYNAIKEVKQKIAAVNFRATELNEQIIVTEASESTMEVPDARLEVTSEDQ